MHSIGGGTGSGLGSLILEKLSEEYSDKLNIGFSIFPGSTNGGVSDVVTEPYNSILTLNTLIENCSAVFSIENPALYRIC
jgi:tubulin beta